jgi:hypothetical protein
MDSIGRQAGIVIADVAPNTATLGATRGHHAGALVNRAGRYAMRYATRLCVECLSDPDRQARAFSLNDPQCSLSPNSRANYAGSYVKSRMSPLSLPTVTTCLTNNKGADDKLNVVRAHR